MLVILQSVLGVPPVTNERFDSELRYQVILSLASALREAGLVDQHELAVIESLMREKYQPVFQAA